MGMHATQARRRSRPARRAHITASIVAALASLPGFCGSAPAQADKPAASPPAVAAETAAAGGIFQRLQLSDQFYSEGAYYADFNKDGKPDVAAGPFWFEGGDFQKKHEVCPPKAFDPKGYSDKFFIFAGDFNGDGWPDILHIGFPGRDSFWYENPAGKEGHWKQRPALKGVDGESPLWGDVNGDGRPDLVCCHDGCLGYATYDPAKPDEPWTFVAVSPKRGLGGFTHGTGFGDVNGDGRVDLLLSDGWYEQPAEAKPGTPWAYHPAKFAAAGAQILVYDVDGDGLNDIITSWHCHGYGLVWHRQTKNEKGETVFQQNTILSPNPDVKSDALRISQMHALDLADFNGDGIKDILVGKRFWAHGPGGDSEPGAPAVIYWFETRRDPSKAVQFVPHMIDDNSGVGTQVTAADLNGDKVPDVIVGNKKGIFVFLSRGK